MVILIGYSSLFYILFSHLQAHTKRKKHKKNNFGIMKSELYVNNSLYETNMESEYHRFTYLYEHKTILGAKPPLSSILSVYVHQ